MQLLTRLEGAVARDYLSSSYATTSELAGASTAANAVDNPPSVSEPVAVLAWIPLTTAAVALRLMEFDASVSYMLHQKVESNKDQEGGEFLVSSSSRFLSFHHGCYY